MKRRFGSNRVFLAMFTLLVLTLGACNGGDSGDKGAGGEKSSGDQAKAVEDTIRESVKAENAKDEIKFLALWTDKGLESYDSGTREEIQSGEGEIGGDKIEILKFLNTKVDGDKATTEVNAAPEEFNVARVLYRANFALVKKEDKWLIDDFDFKGSPPPEEGTPVVGITAVDYGFTLDTAEFPGKVAFKFTNGGKEQHELVLFEAPQDIDLNTAKAALENVSGENLDNVPGGYKADHISFVEPGDSFDVGFTDPLPNGTYVIACYIPQGGFGEQGPVNPEGKPHIQLGMINKFTVT